jgi:hypothetical protein
MLRAALGLLIVLLVVVAPLAGVYGVGAALASVGLDIALSHALGVMIAEAFAFGFILLLVKRGR